jgi:hypothetical protein
VGVVNRAGGEGGEGGTGGIARDACSESPVRCPTEPERMNPLLEDDDSCLIILKFCSAVVQTPWICTSFASQQNTLANIDCQRSQGA